MSAAAPEVAQRIREALDASETMGDIARSSGAGDSQVDGVLDRLATELAEYLAPMGVKEIAEYLGVRRPNVRKMLAANDVGSLAELAVGPVYARGSIDALRRAKGS